MRNQTSGILAMLMAIAIWGNFVLVFNYLNAMSPMDIIAHRVLWGLIVFLGFMAFKGRMGEVKAAFHNSLELLAIAFAAFMVALNWLFFVWATGHGHTLEAGLGYFIYPLISVAIGAIFLGERPSRLQWIAVAIASLAVTILTYGIGRLPMVTLALAGTFSIYGLIKRYVKMGAILSVTIENIVLIPFALVWLVLLADHQAGFASGSGYAFWLIMAGALTALALIGFSHAAKTLSYATVGMLFFLNPTIQVLNGAVILGEPLSIWHQVTFPLIAIACGIYIWSLRKETRS